MNVMHPTEVFRQEASELFDVLEGALLDLGQRPDDRELVDSAFRALHTIRRDAVVANPSRWWWARLALNKSRRTGIPCKPKSRLHSWAI
jgi:hypothetical protein